ncbi:HU domain-containing protein [Flavobacterium capsici]|uniref:SPOR domain-containing protein n=1 Tax=Flavobacterium capsici TaxID=3075618 RepID=A0AA96EZG9_9FLAO|nr:MULTISPECIES: SPOR domain-containing protein [unclassified Flavobacterium]WNM19707.1 SPOR domain-containing protein [Flavobacterium sp. PMR2A8]WNM21096.1 SPOR domain-containing protein [Flavobacterium sp. PMTSA4]
MKIEQYISQLLYRYQCVTVPGFGAFLTEIQSAKLDENSHSFYPPKKLISFNPYIKNNDGLLANHLAQAEKINYEVAISVIQTEVDNWRKSIQEFGQLTFKNIGGFSLNSENNLVFVPSDQVNYLKESFGLTSYISPAVKREEVKREEYKEIVEELEEKAPIVFTPEKRKNYSFLKYAAIVLVSIGITGAVGFKLHQNYEERIAQETLLVEQNVQKKINEKIQEATFFIESPLPSVTLTVPSEKMPYHVVAGAFSIESNAENLLERLTKLGYHAKRIPVNKYGLHPVLYGSYSSYSEAYKAMKEIQQVDNPKAWLLIEEF